MVIKVVHHIHKHGSQKNPKNQFSYITTQFIKIHLKSNIIIKPYFSPSLFLNFLVISLLVSWRNEPNIQRNLRNNQPLSSKTKLMRPPMGGG